MIAPQELATWRHEELLAWVAERQRRIAELHASHDALGAALEQLKRCRKRPDAPFATGTRVAAPEFPWRPPGAGPFCSREAPRPAQIAEAPVAIRVLLDACSADYAGVMVTDRRRSYDAHAFARVAQQKCLAYMLRSMSNVLATKHGRARDFRAQLKTLSQVALALGPTHRDG